MHVAEKTCTAETLTDGAATDGAADAAKMFSATTESIGCDVSTDAVAVNCSSATMAGDGGGDATSTDDAKDSLAEADGDGDVVSIADVAAKASSADAESVG